MKVRAVDNLIKELKASPANIRCKRLKKGLEELGFTVTDGKKSGHKILTHEALSGFSSASYSCGHGRNPTVLEIYVKQLIKMLSKYKLDLENILG
jgi:hypothetical protein